MPGATDLNPFVECSNALLDRTSMDISSNPPGKNGTYPDFPLTKFLLGAGALSNDVEFSPVVFLKEGTFKDSSCQWLSDKSR
jgi:hypothetical protein